MMNRKTALTVMTAFMAAVWIGLWLCLVLGCAGEIDPGEPLKVSSSSEASGSWVIQHRRFP